MLRANSSTTSWVPLPEVKDSASIKEVGKHSTPSLDEWKQLPIPNSSSKQPGGADSRTQSGNQAYGQYRKRAGWVQPLKGSTQIQRRGEYEQTKLNNNAKLEALRERRPPWPRQIITPILSTVKMLNGCERLPPPPPPPPTPKKKVLDHYLHHDLGMLPLLRCFFAHLLILQYPDHHQNLISSYLYYSGPVHKISSQSVHNCLSNVVHRQTNRQTNQRYQKHNLLCQGGNYTEYHK